jgi:DNA repair protein RecN (Recombination protein N)
MLEQLMIENFALIEQLDLNLMDGMTIFTGETGAGKSILLDAIAFLLGARGNTSAIRSGKSHMTVTGYFTYQPHSALAQIIEQYELVDEESERLCIWRELNDKGKGQIRINGKPASLNILRECADSLIEINGQHGYQQLFQPKNHLMFLDQTGDRKHRELLQTYHELYQHWRETTRKLTDLRQGEREGLQMMELWQYQAREIQEAQLDLEEEERLHNDRKRLSSVQKNKTSLEKVYNLLEEDRPGSYGAISALRIAVRELVGIAQSESRLSETAAQLESCFYTLEEVANDLSHYKNQLEEDPKALERIEERLSLLSQLKRKYGNFVKDILIYYQTIQEKIASAESNDQVIGELEKRVQNLEINLKSLGQKLSVSRQTLAQTLSQSVMRELAELEMPRCRFEVSFHGDSESSEAKFMADGLERCEFFISTNIGEPLKPLLRIASGGELSRIMLALRSVMLQGDIPIVIFDEIDTGISGETVQRVAEKLAKLSRHYQLLLVTHQPIVAAMGDHHVFIRKVESQDRTYTLLKVLTEKEIEEELIRLIAGNQAGEAASALAKDLLRNAKNWKSGSKILQNSSQFPT